MFIKMLGRNVFFVLRSMVAGILIANPAATCFAEEREHPFEEHGHHEFREHDIRRFDRHEHGLWRGGVWRHEWHNGRSGWWWMVGGVWYFYDRPFYPYPLIVSGTAFADPIVTMPPAPTVVAPGAPIVIQQAAPPPQIPMWYYCDSPAGYFPYIPNCDRPFRPVPAMPQ